MADTVGSSPSLTGGRRSFALIHEAINKYGVPPAAVLWLLTFGPFATRRMIRRKRGRCTNCGYDLSHAAHEACPECGVEV